MEPFKGCKSGNIPTKERDFSMKRVLSPHIWASAQKSADLSPKTLGPTFLAGYRKVSFFLGFRPRFSGILCVFIFRESTTVEVEVEVVNSDSDSLVNLKSCRKRVSPQLTNQTLSVSRS